MKIKSIDTNTHASTPGNISIDNSKLRKLRSDLYGVKAWIKGLIDKKHIGYTVKRRIEEHIFLGDSQPAIVISKKPLIIIAYSDELDCIIPLKFPDEYSDIYMLEEKSKLISINTYKRGSKLQNDILLGPNNSGIWSGFSPIIGEFVSNDIDILTEKKGKISEELWDYVYKLGVEYREYYPNKYRDGRILEKSI